MEYIKKIKNNKFVILENINIGKIIIFPVRFNNPMTTIFIVMDLILLFPLGVIGLSTYYSEFIYKIGLIAFSIPWLIFGIFINSFLLSLLIDKTVIDITSEEVKIFCRFKKNGKNQFSFDQKEIKALKLCKYNVDPNNKKSTITFPDIVFILKNSEYSLRSFSVTEFTDEEIILLINTFNKHLKKDIIERI